MLASQTPWECDGKALYCSVARFAAALAFFTSLSCELLFFKKKTVTLPPPVFPFLIFNTLLLRQFSILKRNDIHYYCFLIHSRHRCLPGICFSDCLWRRTGRQSRSRIGHEAKGRSLRGKIAIERPMQSAILGFGGPLRKSF